MIPTLSSTQTSSSASLGVSDHFKTVRRDRFILTMHKEHMDELLGGSLLTEPMGNLISRYGSGGDGGRGSVARVDIPGIGYVFVRDYRHGGLLRAVLGRRFFIPGRETRELLILQAARSRNLPVPVPVACARENRGIGLGYFARIVTAEIPNASSLVPTLWEKMNQARDTAPLFRSVGEIIRAMHDAGIYHHDLNMHNILVDEDDRVFIIDFDRAWIRTRLGNRGRIANLRRLLRSGRKLSRLHRDAPAGWFSDERFAELLRGYAGADARLHHILVQKTVLSRFLYVRSHIGWALDDFLYKKK